MKRALIIDDERTMRLLLEETLSTTHDCTLVCGGREGFRLACEPNAYDIITMDIAMPDWDGLSALALVQALNPLSKIIVISGHISSEHEAQLNSLACVRGVISKPFSLKEFVTLVERLEAQD